MKLIKTESEYDVALARIDALMHIEDEGPQLDELEVLGLLVAKYEEEHYPIPPATPIEAIKFKMEQMGLNSKDLQPYIGSRGRVSEILNGKRGLSLNMIKSLHHGLGIPFSSLIV
jgi:HTH-type transcriptional regulator/antitoxin HigA